jgi:hypothetical protein
MLITKLSKIRIVCINELCPAERVSIIHDTQQACELYWNTRNLTKLASRQRRRQKLKTSSSVI